MKRTLPIWLVIPCLIWAAPAADAALEVPTLEARITDRAGVLTPEQIRSLEQRAKDLETSDSTQVAVLVIPSLEGEVLEDYSERVATAWKLGQKGRDNGALLLIAMKERGVRIEVGYGLEHVLTDARSRRIIENDILPHFRGGDFYDGIDAGLAGITQVVRGVYEATPRPRRDQPVLPARQAYDWLIFSLVPLLWLLSSTGKWGGGILGAGAGLFLGYSLFGAALLALLIAGALGAILGALLGALIRASAGRRGGAGWWIGGGPFRHGTRGGSFGGRSWGGGGFSGGGGAFGGGGASGRW